MKISLNFLFPSRIILKLKKKSHSIFRRKIFLSIVLHKKVIEITNKSLYSHF